MSLPVFNDPTTIITSIISIITIISLLQFLPTELARPSLEKYVCQYINFFVPVFYPTSHLANPKCQMNPITRVLCTYMPTARTWYVSGISIKLFIEKITSHNLHNNPIKQGCCPSLFTDEESRHRAFFPRSGCLTWQRSTDPDNLGSEFGVCSIVLFHFLWFSEIISN